MGYGAVSLQEIAQRLEMSRGNLAYHFKDKELLLKAIGEQMWQEIQRERAIRKNLPSFQNLHRDIKAYYQLQKKYQFIFWDTNVLNHPLIKTKIRDWADLTIQDNEAAIAFAIQLGNMKPEPFPGVYHNLAITTWILFYYWLSQKVVRGDSSPEDAEKAVWSLIIPHFTDRGVEAFKKFFGTEFLENLGRPFDIELRDIIMF